jgi:hypothetical protein
VIHQENATEQDRKILARRGVAAVIVADLCRRLRKPAGACGRACRVAVR